MRVSKSLFVRSIVLSVALFGFATACGKKSDKTAEKEETKRSQAAQVEKTDEEDPEKEAADEKELEEALGAGTIVVDSEEEMEDESVLEELADIKTEDDDEEGNAELSLAIPAGRESKIVIKRASLRINLSMLPSSTQIPAAFARAKHLLGSKEDAGERNQPTMRFRT